MPPFRASGPRAGRSHTAAWIAGAVLLVAWVVVTVFAARVGGMALAEFGGLVGTTAGRIAEELSAGGSSLADARDVDDGDAPDADVRRCRLRPLKCITLTVPVDHSNPAAGETTVTFVVQEATGERRGALVIALGGPGAAGTQLAEWYLEWLEPLEEEFDLVFFDQRGVGLAGEPANCPIASARLDGSWERSDGAGEAAEVVEDARSFAEACAEDIGVSRADVHHFASWQSAGDIEAFREHIGDEMLYVYGESYGTIAARAYADAYPDRVAALILDGPIDIGEDLQALALGRTAAFSEVLDATLAACADDSFCAGDFPGDDPVAGYDALAERLASGPIPFELTNWNGDTITEELTIADLRIAGVISMYAEYDRMLFLRALASAGRDRFVPLAVLSGKTGWGPLAFYPYTELGPYYAIQCADLAREAGGDRDALAAEFLAAGETAGVPEMRLGALYHDFLPCVYWPESSVAWPQPAAQAGAEYPTIILSATTDPATPHEDARRLFEETPNAHLISVEDGPHGVLSAGDPCVLDPMLELLIDGQPIAEEEIRCESFIYPFYAPVLRASLADYPDALEAMIAVDDHITLLPQFTYWDLTGTVRVACDLGGTLSMESGGDTVAMTFSDCTFIEGLTFTNGSATYRLDSEAFSMDVTLPNGALQYERDANFRFTLEGTLDGTEIDLSY